MDAVIGEGSELAAAVPPRGARRRRLVAMGAAAALLLGVGVSAAVAASPGTQPVGRSVFVASAGTVDPAANAAFTAFAQCMRDHGIDMPDPVRIQPAPNGPLPPAVGVGGAGGTTVTAVSGAGATWSGTIVASGGFASSGTIVASGPAQAIPAPSMDPAFQAANDACASLLPAPPTSGDGSGPTVTISGGTSIAGGTGVIVGPGLPGTASGSVGTAGAVIVPGGGDTTAQAKDLATWATCMRAHAVDVPDPVVDTKAGTVQLQFSADPASDAFRQANAACATGTFSFAPPVVPVPPAASTAP